MILSSKKQAAFSLPELLLSLVILTLILGFSVSHFADLLLKRKLALAAQQLSSSLQFARLYALTHHQTVALCPSVDHHQCLANWRLDLIIRTESADDSAEQLLKVLPSLDPAIYLRSKASRSEIRFGPNGKLQTLPMTLQICTSKNSINFAISIILSKTGRNRIRKVAYSCATL